ncbi:CocE/NonD family hydrolase [Shouchella sp. 1P09AA]|uniref:CocE/NonD family hydrolase n=1 Tax=unclassified Shouchella TaxID=2893065 RepID=UPI0039A35137
MMSRSLLIEKDVPCRMRDGVTLYANIYRLNDQNTYPVLLTRVIDGKDSHLFRPTDLMKLVEKGYVVIVQDVRGRFASEGTFTPFFHEEEDGSDTIDWAVHLPYTTSKVAMFGEAYSAYTQYAAAKAAPPHLSALFPVHLIESKQAFSHRNRFLNSKKVIDMALSLTKNIIEKREIQAEHKRDQLFHLFAYQDRQEALYRYQPIQKLPVFKMLGVQELFTTLIKESPVETDSLTYPPSYFLTGWYDDALPHTLRAFQTATKQDSDRHLLLVGPWTGNRLETVQSFGYTAHIDTMANGGSLTDFQLRWFDRWLKNEKNGIDDDAQVLLFVMGINKWRKEKTWPLEQDEQRHVPFTFITEETPHPFSLMRSKDDKQLTFISTPFQDIHELIGTPSLQLHVNQDVMVESFYIRLLAVPKDGAAFQISDELVTVSAETLDENTLKIELSPVAYHFKVGDRMKVEVTNVPNHIYRSHSESSVESSLLALEPCFFHQHTQFVLPVATQPLR